MPKLLEVVRNVLRTRHYSYRTEETYIAWIKQYIIFHNKRHPAEMGAPEVTTFLTHLAVNRHVAASTQNQALAQVGHPPESQRPDEGKHFLRYQQQ
jgi:hypothetical protein